MAQAQAETAALASRLETLHGPGSPLREDVTAEVSTRLQPLPEINARLMWTVALIMAATGMVLVIACANAASLQLARATTRQQELGMRLSLGASRLRLIRQLVTESALELLAGSLALPVTWTILHLAVTKAAEQLPAGFTLILPVRPDSRGARYVLIVSMLGGAVRPAPAMASSASALSSIDQRHERRSCTAWLAAS